MPRNYSRTTKSNRTAQGLKRRASQLKAFKIIAKTAPRLPLEPPREVLLRLKAENANSITSPLREAYLDKAKVLREDELPVKQPIDLFNNWYKEASETVKEPNAMCLATATKNGIPSARFVLCKGITKEGFTFFTNYASRKGEQLEENPHAALTFYWEPLHRSVRIEGIVEKLPMSDAVEYFNSRPYDLQIGSLSSNQSQPIAGRNVLEAREMELKQKYKEGEVPKPETWGGYMVKPTSIEFWQGQTDRIHDRIKFFKADTTSGDYANDEITHQGDDGWLYQRLAP